MTDILAYCREAFDTDSVPIKNRMLRKACDRIEALEAALRKAQEALEPFAKEAARLSLPGHFDKQVIRPTMTHGELRRARVAHAEIEKVLK